MGKINDALKKTGLKVNGKEPNGKTAGEILDNFAEDYTGGGTGGSSNVFTNTDFYSLVGKHLSVDKLIALLQSKNINQSSDDFKIGRGIKYSEDMGSATYGNIIWYYNSSDMMISIFGYDLGLTFDTDIDTTLQNAKTDIEAIILTDIMVKDYVYFINNEFTYTVEGEQTNVSITLDEILDLFEE